VAGPGEADVGEPGPVGAHRGRQGRVAGDVRALGVAAGERQDQLRLAAGDRGGAGVGRGVREAGLERAGVGGRRGAEEGRKRAERTNRIETVAGTHPHGSGPGNKGVDLDADPRPSVCTRAGRKGSPRPGTDRRMRDSRSTSADAFGIRMPVRGGSRRPTPGHQNRHQHDY
jgi:hypothetical protein